VRDALATKYGIDPSRLSTRGFGASQPKDTNDTPEGRARNRRVELVRR
jgi:outer membrane protein OmpA-like peptidoglycan-associated protein